MATKDELKAQELRHAADRELRDLRMRAVELAARMDGNSTNLTKRRPIVLHGAAEILDFVFTGQAPVPPT